MECDKNKRVGYAVNRHTEGDNHETLASFHSDRASSAAYVARRALAQPVRVGIVTFLSGPAAGPFGVPARNAAEVIAEVLNAGTVPAPYATKGFGGRPIELVIIDEAGGPQKQVAEFRNLAQRVDIVIGYISSGDCLAIAPVAEELKKLTVLVRLRHAAHLRGRELQVRVPHRADRRRWTTSPRALYLLERNPNVKSFAGINQNYAWGQDSWTDFEAAMKALKPDVEVATSQMPKLFAGQYGAEISALLVERRRGDPLELLGRRPRRAGAAGRAARPVPEARWC